jgi:acyl-CoA synthetase (NDP forming)
MGGARLDALFAPRSIALVGASDRSRWSALVDLALKAHGFPGSVAYVNPGAATVHGSPAVAALQELDEPIDVAYVMVPPDQVAGVVADGAAAGTKSFVVLTSGFAEAGPDGAERQAALTRLAAGHGVVILGPNTLGYVNVGASVALMPGVHVRTLRRGAIGLVSQSGALAASILRYLEVQGCGLSMLVATGNEAVVGLPAVVEHLAGDAETRVVALFVESIRDPGALLAAADVALEAGKPVVALKIGRTELAARTAAAHTGALVGEDRAVDAAFRRHGIVRVDSLEELVTTANVLARVGRTRGNAVAVLGHSGGACDLAADAAEERGIDLVPFAGTTVGALRELVPGAVDPHNPFDVTGAYVRDTELYGRAARIVSRDPGADVVLCISEIPEEEGGAGNEVLARIGEAVAGMPLPALFTTPMGAGFTPRQLENADAAGVPLVGGGIDAVLTGLGAAFRWSALRCGERGAGVEEIPGLPPPSERRGRWSEAAARKLLEAAVIPAVPAVLARIPAEAAAAASHFAGPCCVKAVSSALEHKSDVGGVLLGLAGPADVSEAAGRLLDPSFAGGPLEGVLVSPMRSGGVELIAGVIRDPDWGLLLSVGIGGVFVEVLSDVGTALLPVDADDVADLLRGLRGWPLLAGTRGSLGADLDACVDAIVRLGRLAEALSPELDAIEINPLLAGPGGVEALDVLVSWRPAP